MRKALMIVVTLSATTATALADPTLPAANYTVSANSYFTNGATFRFSVNQAVQNPPGDPVAFNQINILLNENLKPSFFISELAQNAEAVAEVDMTYYFEVTSRINGQIDITIGADAAAYLESTLDPNVGLNEVACFAMNLGPYKLDTVRAQYGTGLESSTTGFFTTIDSWFLFETNTLYSVDMTYNLSIGALTINEPVPQTFGVSGAVDPWLTVDGPTDLYTLVLSPGVGNTPPSLAVPEPST
jgi:hypothetical protein